MGRFEAGRSGGKSKTELTTNKAENHNERLEFLGDAVLEFVTTWVAKITFIAKIVQNSSVRTARGGRRGCAGHVPQRACSKQASGDSGRKVEFGVVSRFNRELVTLVLCSYLQYAHGPDLCHEADLRHALANAFEAIAGDLYLKRVK